MMIYDVRAKNSEGKKGIWSLTGGTGRIVRGIKAGYQQVPSKKETMLAERDEKVSDQGK